MELLVNDLSMHGQFHELASFQTAVGTLMRIRAALRRHGFDLACRRSFCASAVTEAAGMVEAVNSLPEAQRRAVMQWLTRQGPYWEDERVHGGDDWIESDGQIVTDTALGEAAVCIHGGLDRTLVSIDPSDWLEDPLQAEWIRDTERAEVEVPNVWTPQLAEGLVRDHPRPLNSWDDLAVRTRIQCTNLTFSDDAFAGLRGVPFSRGPADRLRVVLVTLDRFKASFDDEGARTDEGHRLYQDHFTGDKAWFSDSSDTEKTDFKDALTFKHPEDAAQTLFCTWHGKVKTPQLRIHFSWPVAKQTPTYVVYVGPKLTKR